MINIRTLRKIGEGGGLTLRRGTPVAYKSGYQVATEGTTTSNIGEVRRLIKNFNGDCGLWLSQGIWYVDKSHREPTLKAALACGREHDQQTILRWRDLSLINC